MKKILTVSILLLIANFSLAQLITEFWDVAQTKKKSEQLIKDGMQDGKFMAWYEN